MKFSEYQDNAVRFKKFQKSSDDFFIGLSAEVGELMSERMRENRIDRTPRGRKEIKAELGDILWYVTAIADEYNLDLEDIANYNIFKLEQRKAGKSE